jgi:outer membrane PBP1 activator LpoA protein
MKNYILTLLIGIILVGCSNDEETELVQSSCEFISFKYYNETQDYLGEMSDEYILIAVDTTLNDNEIENFIETIDIIDQNYNYTNHTSGQYKFKEIPLKLNTSKNCEEITQIVSDINQNTFISYVHFTMVTDDCNNLIWEPIGDLCINSYGSSFM